MDIELGLVVTNAHVSGLSPCQLRVAFENGERCGGRVLLVDAWHDFAFIKIDMKEVDWPLTPVTFGESFTMKEQEECCLIGNNDSEEYSVKFGVVTNLAINRGDCHTHAFQTSFDRTGGSSGSPVFNAHGKMVGLHMRGTDTTSIELRVEYIKDALEQIRAGVVRRGTIGVELDLVRLSNVVKHCDFPKSKLRELRFNWSTAKHIVAVDRTVPLGSSELLLRPADVIWKVNDILIGNNLYLFDRIVDQNVGRDVKLTIVRNGKEHTIEVAVEDVEALKVRKFALFAGGIFHDITPALRSKFNILAHGTFLNQVSPGSCLSDLGDGTAKHPESYVVVIEELCGVKTPTLEHFIEAVRQLGSKKEVYALTRNLRSFSSALLAKFISLDLKFEPLRIFNWDDELLEWIEEDKLAGIDALSIVPATATATPPDSPRTGSLASFSDFSSMSD